MKKQKKLNNKGFSMVELVIVIAIMAVLIAVLAPQYIKYVESSRVSTDDTNANEVLKVVQILVADGTIKTDCTVEWSDKKIESDLTGDVKTAVESAIVAALSNEVPEVKSKARTAAVEADTGYVVTVDFGDDGAVSVKGAWNS